MTKKYLDELYELREQLREGEEMLDCLRERALPGATIITGMPHSGGISDRVGESAIAIAEAEKDLEELKDEIKKREESVRAWINTVQGIKPRTALRLRYLEGRPWKEIAHGISKYCGVNAAKAMCYKAMAEDM